MTTNKQNRSVNPVRNGLACAVLLLLVVGSLSPQTASACSVEAGWSPPRLTGHDLGLRIAVSGGLFGLTGWTLGHIYEGTEPGRTSSVGWHGAAAAVTVAHLFVAGTYLGSCPGTAGHADDVFGVAHLIAIPISFALAIVWHIRSDSPETKESPSPRLFRPMVVPLSSADLTLGRVIGGTSPRAISGAGVRWRW